MKKVIYYFSGTGNSMRAARVIAEKIKAEIISMRCNPEDVPADDCDVIGFVYPVYHWTMPAAAVQFVQKLKISRSAYIFAVTMPGFINGISQERLSEILKSKGCHIDYGNIVYSVASYAIVYPPVPFPKLRVPQMEHKLKKVAEDIAEGRHREYPHANAFVRRRREKVMTPYLELQQYADYPFTVSEDCISCGLCSRVCPCSNIEIRDGKPSFLHHCANCMACVVCCPRRAIGYNISGENRQLLDASGSNTPIVKIMGLPEKRKLYRNPYITAADLTKNRESHE